MKLFRFPLMALLAFVAMLSTVISVPATHAWSDALISVSTFGGADYDSSSDVAIDITGNIYTAGYFMGTVDFDPGAGISELNSNGAEVAYLTKFDESGNFLWVKIFTGTSDQGIESIALDGDGNILMTGYFYGTADFDPGDQTSNLSSSGSADTFIVKLNSSGEFVWAKKLGGSEDDYGYSIATDTSGNVYTTGSFYGSVDFDPGSGSVSLTSVDQNDIYVSKLNSSGNFIWAKAFGGSSFDESLSIAIDNQGNIVTSGYFFGTVDFNPGSGTSNLSSNGSMDFFISKLDSSGDFLWAKNMGGSSNDSSESMAVDENDNILVTGSFSGTADFDPGLEEANLTSAGSLDIYISKYSSSGDFLWANRFGGSRNDYANGVSVHSNGDVYTTGVFTGTVDFDSGADTINLVSAGNWDVFILKTASTGDYLWAKGIGGSNEDYATSLALDSNGNVFTTGYFAGTVDFDPGTNTAELTSGGLDDVFILRLNASGEAETSLASVSEPSSSSPSTSSSSNATTDSAAAAAAAAAIREAAKQAARAELVVGFKEAKPATVQKFAAAGINGVTESNIEAVNLEIALLPESSRLELASILKIARKFEVVGAIASNQVKQISPSLFVEIGLIASDSKHKTSLVNAVKRLDVKDRNSYEAIKRALASEMTVIKKRADRITKLLDRASAGRN